MQEEFIALAMCVGFSRAAVVQVVTQRIRLLSVWGLPRITAGGEERLWNCTQIFPCSALKWCASPLLLFHWLELVTRPSYLQGPAKCDLPCTQEGETKWVLVNALIHQPCFLHLPSENDFVMQKDWDYSLCTYCLKGHSPSIKKINTFYAKIVAQLESSLSKEKNKVTHLIFSGGTLMVAQLLDCDPLMHRIWIEEESNISRTWDM